MGRKFKCKHCKRVWDVSRHTKQRKNNYWCPECEKYHVEINVKSTQATVNSAEYMAYISLSS